MYIYTYIYIYTHTYIHKCICTYRFVQSTKFCLGVDFHDTGVAQSYRASRKTTEPLTGSLSPQYAQMENFLNKAYEQSVKYTTTCRQVMQQTNY